MSTIPDPVETAPQLSWLATGRVRGVALWRQIEARLEESMAAGHYPQGRLPTEEALAAQFAVNRHTIRQALQGLKERGLLDTRQGRGSFVRQSAIEYALGTRTRFSENLARHNLSAELKVLDAGVHKAAGSVTKALGLRAGARVEWVVTVGLADGVPVSTSTHYFPAVRLKGVGAALQQTGSVTRAFTQLGVADYLRSSTRITAGLPDALTAQRLETGPQQPVLRVLSINVDASGKPLQYSETAFCAERVQLVVDNPEAP
ncbi:MAG: phosphonate metabolism transcriptional regulator PhnF [Pseudomonadota bacterium]